MGLSEARGSVSGRGSREHAEEDDDLSSAEELLVGASSVGWRLTMVQVEVVVSLDLAVDRAQCVVVFDVAVVTRTTVKRI